MKALTVLPEHIMRKAGRDESPVGIKIAGRNINNLRYADDTTLMAESEEELKSLLMRVKEESTKVGLKLNIKKTKTVASGPLTSWQIDGEEMEKEDLLAAMPAGSHLRFLNIPPTSHVLQKFTADVTFDPETAHPSLAVTENNKKVENVPRPEHVPDNPERFNSTPCLLGSPGFTSGKHYWEVVYGNQREWAVGVARKSVKRKEYLRLSPEEGIWQKGLWWLSRAESGLSRPPPPNPTGTIGVFLDYDEQLVTFYMGNQVTEVQASFNGEKVFPFFYVGGTVVLSL
ncbi:Ohanin [Varanus komodoensis]|nr:Ohanin [Varanus komodoensis]